MSSRFPKDAEEPHKRTRVYSNLLIQGGIGRIAESRDSAPDKDSIPLQHACRALSPASAHSYAATCFAVLPWARVKATKHFQAVIVSVCQAASAHSCITGDGARKRINRSRSKCSCGRVALPETLERYMGCFTWAQSARSYRWLGEGESSDASRGG